MSSDRSYSLKDALSRLNGKDKSLNGIYLFNKRIGDDGVSLLVEAMLRFEMNQVKCLRLAGNNISDKGATKLARLLLAANVEALFLNSNKITDKGAQQIAKSLANTNCTLRFLLLSKNKIGDNGATEIANALSFSNSTLEQLHLSSNNIGDRGTQALAKVLVHNSALRSLLLDSDNTIGKQTVKMMLESLKYNSTMCFVILPPGNKRSLKGGKYSSGRIHNIVEQNSKGARDKIVQRNKQKLYIFPFTLNKLFPNSLPNDLKICIREYCFGDIIGYDF